MNQFGCENVGVAELETIWELFQELFIRVSNIKYVKERIILFNR